jgi:CheY-like chemotaxis protein
MLSKNIHILLADDDPSDCLLFKEALEELPVSAKLTIVNNGEQLIELISKKGNKLPDVLFLDLNMPRKNGFAALGQIKRSNELDQLPVIIFSTTSDIDTIKKVFRNAAHYYITKPADFLQLKKVIYEALTLIKENNKSMPLVGDFMITGNSVIIPA